MGNAGGAGFRLTGDLETEGERFKFWENDWEVGDGLCCCCRWNRGCQLWTAWPQKQ